MRSEPATGSAGKDGGRTHGRHAAPRSSFGKLALRAGKFAPVVIAAGALAIAPYAFTAAGRDALAGHDTTALRPASAGLLYASFGHDVGPLPSGYASDPLPAGATQKAGRTRPHRHRSHASGQASHRSTAPTASASTAAAPASTPRRSQSAATCSGTATGGMLPANYAAIVSFLLAHGYSGNAAAGIAGNIYQESGGNPESLGTGGGGLIGWTPLPAGYVTGNPTADLQTQLSAILQFNQIWAQYIPALNAAGSPTAAADIYVTDFERAGIPAASNREAAANAVAAACGL